MRFRTTVCAALCWLCTGQTPMAFPLEMPPSARETATRNTGPDSYRVPVAAFDGATVPTQPFEGAISRRAWRIATQGMTTLQVMQPLREQLENLGYEIVFECDNDNCGGFDFRFGIEVLPGPNMYVNIGRFRFLTAVQGPADAPEDIVTVLTSATAASAYVQIIRGEASLRPGQPTIAALESNRAAFAQTSRLSADQASIAQFVASLEQIGHVVLNDLQFETGSTDLGSGDFRSLSLLAEILEERPDWRLALVGHTDTVGGLQPNISVSRARAQSVRSRLITEYGVAADRLDAEGMGYLAPIASNLTADTRAENRRVEAVLLTTP